MKNASLLVRYASLDVGVRLVGDAAVAGSRLSALDPLLAIAEWARLVDDHWFANFCRLVLMWAQTSAHKLRLFCLASLRLNYLGKCGITGIREALRIHRLPAEAEDLLATAYAIAPLLVIV